MTPHDQHCGCAAYLRGVLHNIKRVGCRCRDLLGVAQINAGERCDLCRLVKRALAVVGAAQAGGRFLPPRRANKLIELLRGARVERVSPGRVSGERP